MSKAGRRGPFAAIAGIVCLFFSGTAARAEEPPALIYLDAPEPPRDRTVGILFSTLLREIVRQEFLRIAHYDLGLRTRDASLREPKPAKLPADNVFRITTLVRPPALTVTVERGPDGRRTTLWQHEYTLADGDADKKRDNESRLVEFTAGTLRQDFTRVLTEAGFKPRAARPVPNVEVPAETERLLQQPVEMYQFVALRQLDAAIAAKGESPQLAAALARGYAQLAILTEFHWAADYNVFRARALLWARRVVEMQPGAADALREEGYVLALVGLHRRSMEVLSEAYRITKAPTPATPRAVLAEALYKFKSDTLLKVAEKGGANAQMARLLAFLAVEDFTAVRRTLAAARELLKKNPACYRVHDCLATLSSAPLRAAATEAAFDAFAAETVQRLPFLPGLPAEIIQLAKNDAAEPELLEALSLWTEASTEATEPSWAVLGRVLQETRFAQICRRADVLEAILDAAPTDFLDKAVPLAAGHPYAPYLEVHRLPKPRKADDVLRLLAQVPLVDLDYNRRPLIVTFGEADWRRNVQMFGLTTRYGDSTWRSYTQLVRINKDEKYREPFARALVHTSPYSPLGRAALLDLDGAETEKWMKQWPTQADPTVLRGLGTLYARQKKFDDAERCLKESIALSPDYTAYETLAKAYLAQDRFDMFKETLEASLKEEDLGWEHAQALNFIARAYLRRLDYQSALPYAERAARGGGLSWAEMTESDCREGLGQWDAAEKHWQWQSTNVPDHWYYWYLWCRRTGHGDLPAAEAIVAERFADAAQRATRDDWQHVATLYLLRGQPDKARAAADNWFHDHPTATSGFFLASIEDSLGKAADRDKTLRTIKLPATNPYRQLADLFQRRLAGDDKDGPDPKAVDALLLTYPETERTDFAYLVGHFLALRGNKEAAAKYLERCTKSYDRRSDTLRTLAAVELRELVKKP